MQPTTAPTVEIQYCGEARTLKFGLLAYRDIGINPFSQSSVIEFFARPLDLDLAARMIRAGMLHEYHGKNATRRGQQPPTPEDILADMDGLYEFVSTWKDVAGVLGEKPQDGEPKHQETATENPPPA